MELKKLKVVLWQYIYHLLFPLVYRKGKQNESWAGKPKLVWTMSGPLPIQATVVSHVAAKDDGPVGKK